MRLTYETKFFSIASARRRLSLVSLLVAAELCSKIKYKYKSSTLKVEAVWSTRPQYPLAQHRYLFKPVSRSFQTTVDLLSGFNIRIITLSLSKSIYFTNGPVTWNTDGQTEEQILWDSFSIVLLADLSKLNIIQSELLTISFVFPVKSERWRIVYIFFKFIIHCCSSITRCVCVCVRTISMAHSDWLHTPPATTHNIQLQSFFYEQKKSGHFVSKIRCNKSLPKTSRYP